LPTLAKDESKLQIDVQQISGGFAIRATFPVSVRPTQAFAVMTDYDHMAQFIPQMRKSQILWRNGEHESVLQEGSVDLLWLHFPSFVVMSVHLASNDAVLFHSTSGNLEISGRAQVRPTAAGSVVDYVTTMKPQIAIPLGLAQNFVAHYIRQQMIALRAEMLRVGTHPAENAAQLSPDGGG
jgi:carbon monoxide dehydrogenase subunit G